MKQFKKDFLKLNSTLMSNSNNKFDLRTFPQILNNTEQNWGLVEVAANIDLNDIKMYKETFQTNDERDLLKKLLAQLSENPSSLVIVESLLTRKILYLGSECNNLGRINIENEFSQLEKILTNKYLSIERVTNPNISNFIDKWDEVKPKIILISCHGTEFGLYLQDEEGECKEYVNTDFLNFFKKRSEHTECVVLSACESLALGEKITDDGKNVVCINSKVDIQTSTKYTYHFFKYINDHSLENVHIYEDAHLTSMEKIQFEGLKDNFSFEFLKAKKIF